MDLSFASIVSAAGSITVHLSDNDPFTADWRANAADWLGKLGAAVHIAHGAGHYMTTSPDPVLDTIRVGWPSLEITSRHMKTWFITGASRGFGALITEAALATDAVVATARDPSSIADHPRLLKLPLDVTNDAQAREAAAEELKSSDASTFS